MKDDELLCPASENHGKFLLSEMMLAGNFGHYDERMAQLVVTSYLIRSRRLAAVSQEISASSLLILKRCYVSQ